jgi:hypothetical protein
MTMAILDQVAPSRKLAGSTTQILRIRELCDALPCFIRRQRAGRTSDSKLQVLDQLFADETRGIAERLFALANCDGPPCRPFLDESPFV